MLTPLVGGPTGDFAYLDDPPLKEETKIVATHISCTFVVLCLGPNMHDVFVVIIK